jgi:hypothetical protein
MRPWLLLSVLFACSSSEPVPPRLSAIEQRIFVPNCTFSSCHSSAGHAGGLVLEPGKSFASLVQQACQQDAALQAKLLRVAPGDPARSFLILKLRDPLDPAYGARMPQGSPALDGTDLASIEEWIRRGAAND